MDFWVQVLVIRMVTIFAEFMTLAKGMFIGVIFLDPLSFFLLVLHLIKMIITTKFTNY
jgi:hypothetical protein